MLKSKRCAGWAHVILRIRQKQSDLPGLDDAERRPAPKFRRTRYVPSIFLHASIVHGAGNMQVPFVLYVRHGY